MAVSQKDRLIRIATPLGESTFVVLSFTGYEYMCNLFSFELQLASQRNNITFEQIGGKNVTVAVRCCDNTERFFNGIIVEFEPGDVSLKEGYSSYRAVMAPAIWVLTQCTDYRIFQNKSVPDIIQAVLDKGVLERKGVGQTIDLRMDLSRSHAPRQYCVQYQESDLDFIKRLCEAEGIFYYFEHENGRHTVVFGDDAGRHKPIAAGAKGTVAFQQALGGTSDQEGIVSLRPGNRMTTGKYVARDFNFTIPDNDMTVQSPSSHAQVAGQGETYEYPGGYLKTNAEGQNLAKVRMQALDARFLTLRGRGSCRGFCPGFKFKLKDHALQALNGKAYVLLRVRHEARQHFASGPADGDSYFNLFACLPAKTPFRPERRTSRPVIAGSQTAIVTGPKGEEIHTDKHGRVKVRFHWDRNPDNKSDENLTCWIRVSQAWAGAGYGAVHIPRVGQEVIVNFLEGDPDRPIITGRVYHGKNLAPHALPAEKTKSTIMSNSSKNGHGNNEIMFEDLKDAELFFTHAAKDHSEVVEHDKSTQVKNSQTIQVEKDRSVTVAGGNETVAIQAGGRTLSVTADEKHTNAANFRHNVSGSYTLRVNGNITIDATGIIKIIGARVFLNP